MHKFSFLSNAIGKEFNAHLWEHLYVWHYFWRLFNCCFMLSHFIHMHCANAVCVCVSHLAIPIGLCLLWATYSISLLFFRIRVHQLPVTLMCAFSLLPSPYLSVLTRILSLSLFQCAVISLVCRRHHHST